MGSGIAVDAGLGVAIGKGDASGDCVSTMVGARPWVGVGVSVVDETAVVAGWSWLGAKKCQVESCKPISKLQQAESPTHSIRPCLPVPAFRTVSSILLGNEPP